MLDRLAHAGGELVEALARHVREARDGEVGARGDGAGGGGEAAAHFADGLVSGTGDGVACGGAGGCEAALWFCGGSGRLCRLKGESGAIGIDARDLSRSFFNRGGFLGGVCGCGCA